MKKTYLPNLLTLCRIVLSFCLLLLPYQSVLFVLLYLVCGLTDILDGFLARKLNTETQVGAKLDSLADLCMCVMIIITITKQTHANILVLIGICIIFVIRLGNALFSKFKFKRISSIHTNTNKIAGLLFFICPLTCDFTNIPLYITGIAALLSSAEEFLILLRSNVLNLNRKSMFSKS